MNLKSATKLFFDTEDEEVMRPTLVERPDVMMRVRYPKSFADVKECADALLNGDTLIISYENLNEEDSCRVVDYLSGVAYSMNASIEQISMEMLMYAPASIAIEQNSKKASSF